MNTNTPDFHISVVQDGKIIKATKGAMVLDKKPFSFVFELSQPMSVLINASFDEDTYVAASKHKEMSTLFGYENIGMAEAIFNPEKEIFIADESCSLWFYESEELHRFDNIKKKNGKVICTRIIENFFDVDADATFPVEEIDRILYLVFIAYEQGDDVNEEIELKREMIKIAWK